MSQISSTGVGVCSSKEPVRWTVPAWSEPAWLLFWLLIALAIALAGGAFVSEQHVPSRYFFWLGVLAASGIALVLLSSKRVHTPIGKAHYIIQRSLLGARRFYGVQIGPAASPMLFLAETWEVPLTEVMVFCTTDGLLTKERVPISCQYQIRFRVPPEKIRPLIEGYLGYVKGQQSLAEAVFRVTMVPTARGCLSSNVMKYSLNEVAKARVSILAAMTAALHRKSKYPFEIVSVSLRIILPEGVTEAAVAEEVAKVRAENMTLQVQMAEKEKEIMLLRGDGASPQYLAWLEAEAKKAAAGNGNSVSVFGAEPRKLMIDARARRT